MTENVLKPPAEEINFLIDFCKAFKTVDQALDLLAPVVKNPNPDHYINAKLAKLALHKLMSLVSERNFFECSLPNGETLSFNETCQALVDTMNENYELRKKLNQI